MHDHRGPSDKLLPGIARPGTLNVVLEPVLTRIRKRRRVSKLMAAEGLTVPASGRFGARNAAQERNMVAVAERMRHRLCGVTISSKEGL
jgi:hypothetical protein